MAITDKLNAAWNESEENRLLFEYRAIVQDIRNTISESINRIDEIAAESNFQGVDTELKQEGQAIRTKINTLHTGLQDHLDFIDWIQS